ncbi:hypothetical protein BOTBODRAFT_458154 [Botryobasidium botryosum FD-172 SS1]|uniref:Mug135-like C-terminal domain-containing protein n=1 Tax=Botryobasidium botryosum (strain FD-172 SS1) TaxID=930990 RepID=A0A067M734_BOTB1|nr:hypothetical protein BOTBODRAFT_458154 [Botryobasidium botryosum FD-172 SS1]
MLRSDSKAASHVLKLPDAFTTEGVAQAKTDEVSLSAARIPMPAWAQMLIVLSILNYNSNRGSGERSPYKVVPLANGLLPTDARRHNDERFPPIRTEHDLSHMDEDLLDEYLLFYGIYPGPEFSSGYKRDLLARAIGAPDSVSFSHAQ